MDYELVGRMIYGFNRVKGDFDSFCGARQPDGVHADIPVRELADRMVPMLSRQYGADSAIVREFLEVSDILASGEAWFSQMKELGPDVGPPDSGETDRVLSCQQKLGHLRQMMSAA